MPQQLFDILKKDHRSVEDLMDRLVEEEPDQRQELFDQLNEQLYQHLHLEEKYFYPRIKSAEQLKQLVEDALDEHREAKGFLQKLNKTSIETEQWLDMLQEMQEVILHHVDEEEEKIFPRCRDVLENAQLREIAGQIAEEKEKGITSETPHRAAAKQPRKQPRV